MVLLYDIKFKIKFRWVQKIVGNGFYDDFSFPRSINFVNFGYLSTISKLSTTFTPLYLVYESWMNEFALMTIVCDTCRRNYIINAWLWPNYTHLKYGGCCCWSKTCLPLLRTWYQSRFLWISYSQWRLVSFSSVFYV